MAIWFFFLGVNYSGISWSPVWLVRVQEWLQGPPSPYHIKVRPVLRRFPRMRVFFRVRHSQCPRPFLYGSDRGVCLSFSWSPLVLPKVERHPASTVTDIHSGLKFCIPCGSGELCLTLHFSYKHMERQIRQTLPFLLPLAHSFTLSPCAFMNCF